ncbi:MAG: hotdog domain-containing protein [Actinomycetota bacterium]
MTDRATDPTDTHGGFLGVIVDDVCGMAFASLLTEFRPFPTQSMQLEYHRPIMVGETVGRRATTARVQCPRPVGGGKGEP